MGSSKMNPRKNGPGHVAGLDGVGGEWVANKNLFGMGC